MIHQLLAFFDTLTDILIFTMYIYKSESANQLIDKKWKNTGTTLNF